MTKKTRTIASPVIAVAPAVQAEASQKTPSRTIADAARTACARAAPLSGGITAMMRDPAGSAGALPVTPTTTRDRLSIMSPVRRRTSRPLATDFHGLVPPWPRAPTARPVTPRAAAKAAATAGERAPPRSAAIASNRSAILSSAGSRRAAMARSSGGAGRRAARRGPADREQAEEGAHHARQGLVGLELGRLEDGVGAQGIELDHFARHLPTEGGEDTFSACPAAG